MKKIVGILFLLGLSFQCYCQTITQDKTITYSKTTPVNTKENISIPDSSGQHSVPIYSKLNPVITTQDSISTGEKKKEFSKEVPKSK